MTGNELSGSWNFPVPIRFGCGRRAELADACRELGMHKPLLVTDRGIAELPMIDEISTDLATRNVSAPLFSNVDANPTDVNVADGVRAFRDSACDGVVAIGGGSALDAGKAVALMVGQVRPIGDFEDRDDNWRRVDESGMVPCIALPTTAGTGSEVGRASVILDTASREKKIIFHPRMTPACVIADPELTRGLPPPLTAATGLDAFTHCFEAFCAPGFHPMADGIALEGMRLVAEWLPRAYADGDDLQARGHMLAAAGMGAVAFQKGLGAVHALSHAVGGYYGTHHGLTNAVFLPYVMVRNRAAIEDRMVRVAMAVGGRSTSFDGVLEWIVGFIAALGIPATAAELGVANQDIDELAERSLRDPSLAGNPLKLDVNDLREVLQRAIAGDTGG